MIRPRKIRPSPDKAYRKTANVKTNASTIHKSTANTRVRKLIQNTLVFLAVILLAVFSLNVLKKMIPTVHHRTAMEAARLARNGILGKTFVVTGGYSGIGAETVKALLNEGGRVVIGGRNAGRLEEFMASLTAANANSSNNVDGMVLDLSDLESVKTFAAKVGERYDRIVLINNAGIICPAAETKQGIEMQMGTNVVGHFLLSKLLLPSTTRQVWLSSTFHSMLGSPRINISYYQDFSLAENSADYDEWFQQSKTGVILLAKEFHKRYHVETAALHPGTVYTDMGKHIYASPLQILRDSIDELPDIILHEGWWFPIKSPQEGASTTITVAALPSTELKNGGYYKDCAEFDESSSAKNMDDARALFDWCEKVTEPFQ